jgi:3D (Asp-Asp-Asp) domain-containing protein
MSNFKVVASGLNLRSTPLVANNVKVLLPEGQIVMRIGSEPKLDRWWQVRTTLNGKVLEGFVDKSFLEVVSSPFNLPQPDKATISKDLQLWATFYLIPEVIENPNGADLLDMGGNKLGVKLADRDWCNAAVQGTVNVRTVNGKIKTFNFAGTGAAAQVNCRLFFPQLATIEQTNKTRFYLANGKFGEGVDGLKLVPYRSIAVDRTKIPIGTVIFIPAARGVTVILPGGETAIHDGYFFAADVGGAIKDRHIDVFIGTATKNPFPFIKSSKTATFEAFTIANDSTIAQLKSVHLA